MGALVPPEQFVALVSTATLSRVGSFLLPRRVNGGGGDSVVALLLLAAVVEVAIFGEIVAEGRVGTLRACVYCVCVCFVAPLSDLDVRRAVAFLAVSGLC